ncbi:hypothetical protein [Cellulosilyticum ruminicola]|uniref:hypothetical protein n=1 Tax=Cellulosilyticum ruminicola TaxID=425254 RepID=UPI0006D23987|nr:hypothetical protein [Cellulosilyticum ruminicola]
MGDEIFDPISETEEQNFAQALGENFLKYFRGNELRYNFIFDLFLILMKATKVQKDFVWLMGANLGINEKELNFLMNLGMSILEEDSSSYMQLIERVPKNINVRNFIGYTRHFLVGRLIDDDEMVVYYGCEKLEEKPSFNETFKNEEMSMERWVFKQDVLVFENWKIDLSQKQWLFRNNQKVIFRNCELIGDHYPISFDGTGEIIIEQCEFTYFNNRVLVVNDCINVKINKCQFKECVYLYNVYQNSNGGVYFVADKAMTDAQQMRFIEIVDSRFIDCSVWNKEGHYYSDYSLGCSMSIPQRIRNCQFNNCLSYMDMPKRLCNGGSTLFNNGEAEECIVIASHPIL